MSENNQITEEIEKLSTAMLLKIMEDRPQWDGTPELFVFYSEDGAPGQAHTTAIKLTTLVEADHVIWGVAPHPLQVINLILAAGLIRRPEVGRVHAVGIYLEAYQAEHDLGDRKLEDLTEDEIASIRTIAHTPENEIKTFYVLDMDGNIHNHTHRRRWELIDPADKTIETLVSKTSNLKDNCSATLEQLLLTLT